MTQRMITLHKPRVFFQDVTTARDWRKLNHIHLNWILKEPYIVYIARTQQSTKE